MKTLNVILFFLPVFGSIAIAAEVKSPAVLLQEGIYAEETEGNLDKAMAIYNQIRKDYNDVERIAARATYQLGLCNLKKGDTQKAADLFEDVISYYPQQTATVKMAQEQLDKLGVKKTAEGNVFEILGQVNTFIGSKYGEICAEAGYNKLYSNCHIYVVDKDFILRSGGMGYVYNWTGNTITGKYFISSTSYPNQKLYDIMGNPMDIEIVPDENRPNLYNIYWNLKEPLAPGGFFNYGWATDGSKPLPNLGGGDAYSLTMQNHFGQHCYETFFLALPEGTAITRQSEEYTNKNTLNGWDVYWWKKEVPDNNEHTVSITLNRKKAQLLKLESAPWADGEVMELRLKHPTGVEYGTIIYSAKHNKNNWQIISHLYVSEGGGLSQYTYVEADANSFAPIYGQTTNWTGNFAAEYSESNVKLTTDIQDNKNTRDIPIAGVAYDNEQAIYLIRRMPLAEGYEGSFPIFTIQGGAVVECRIKVLAVEDVNVEAGTFKCYKTDLSIYSQEVRSLQHTLWFSADEHKYLVKYDVGGAATMELAKVWQKNKDRPITFENIEPAFSVSIPADWRFYKYESPGPQFSLQLMPPELKAWAVLVWQKRGTDPDSASAMTIAKADFGKLKGFFENYAANQNGFKELKINSLEAVQYLANYQESGNRLKKYDKPKDMVEYRTYIVDASNVYWFVFRIEKDKFEQNKAEFDSIINSFRTNAK
ncbi:MAG: DUF3108 domain-containing protein [Sedimentisphaerales bacterium]